MFAEVKIKQDIDGDFGVIEKYTLYRYGKNIRARALVGVEISDGAFKVCEPHIIWQHQLTPISERDVTPHQYIRAKKPILSKLNDNICLVGIECMLNTGKGKVVTYEPSLVGSDTFLLRPSGFELPEEVENDLITLLRRSDGDRTDFLTRRMGGVYVG